MTRRVSFTGNVKSKPIAFEINDPKGIFVLKSDDRRETYRCILEDDKDIDYLISILKERYSLYD